MKTELDDIKKFYVLERISLEKQCEDLGGSFQSLLVEKDNKEREVVQRITVDHELEMSDFRKATNDKDEEIRKLRENYVIIDNKYKDALEEASLLKTDLDELHEAKSKEAERYEAKLSAAKLEKEKCLRENTEILIRDHKVEMENLRAKLRFMTNPAEQEKIELGALKQRHELDKKRVLELEADKWQNILDKKIEELKFNFEASKETIMKETLKHVEEKEKQIELLRERENHLNLELVKYKDTINQLVESNRDDNDLVEKVEQLEHEKCQLEGELSMERSRRFDMAASVAVCEGCYFTLLHFTFFCFKAILRCVSFLFDFIGAPETSRLIYT